MGTHSRKSKIPKSDDYLTGPALENLSGYLEDPFPSLPSATADQQKSQSTKLSPNVKPLQAISSIKPEVLSPFDNILASMPFRPPTQEVLAEGGSVPTLKDLPRTAFS